MRVFTLKNQFVFWENVRVSESISVMRKSFYWKKVLIVLNDVIKEEIHYSFLLTIHLKQNHSTFGKKFMHLNFFPNLQDFILTRNYLIEKVEAKWNLCQICVQQFYFPTFIAKSFLKNPQGQDIWQNMA